MYSKFYSIYTFIHHTTSLPLVLRWNVDRFHSFFQIFWFLFPLSALSSFKYLIWNEIDVKKTSDYLLLWFLIVKRILIENGCPNSPPNRNTMEFFNMLPIHRWIDSFLRFVEAIILLLFKIEFRKPSDQIDSTTTGPKHNPREWKRFKYRTDCHYYCYL